MSAEFPKVSAGSVLLITLDSCRYDTYLRAATPNLDAVGPVQRAMAPGNFTFASHLAIFAGFTPGDATRCEPYVNPKYAKIFRLCEGGIAGKAEEVFLLQGENIVQGFRRRGYRTIGTGAVGWFNPATETARPLIKDFDEFHYPGCNWGAPQQLQWLSDRLATASQPVFVFLNLGETHVPYYFQGAAWSSEDNPCVPFSDRNDAATCASRQQAALEYLDRSLAPLLDAFAEATTFVCADHGDCWGEDGLWEHGISHPKVLEVPLVFRMPPKDRS